VQGVERQAHAGGGAGCEVLHEYVGLGQQGIEDAVGGLLLEVEGQAFLGAVGPHEVRGQAVDALVVATGKVAAARAFDLDHAGAQVGQLAGAERRGDGMFQADDGDAVQRAGCSLGHGVTCSSSVQCGQRARIAQLPDLLDQGLALGRAAGA